MRSRKGQCRAAQREVFRAQTQLTLIEARIAQTDLELRTRRAEINSLLDQSVDTPLAQPELPHDRSVSWLESI
jgi:outer membrane protein TolC